LEATAAGSAAIEAYDSGLELFLDYEMAAGAAMKQVVADHPECTMATVLRGYMMMMLETGAVHPKVAKVAADGLGPESEANGRERMHFQALDRWAAGDVRGAAMWWDRLLAKHPHDLLALKMHHYTTFWTGRASVLLSAVDGVFDAWNDDVAGYDHVLGMRAFALNETGRWEEAEALGREAVARNAGDLWSIHAVAHALEMQGVPADGDAFFAELGAGSGDDPWASKNPFVGHVWWHAALFPWTAGDYERVLALYDQRILPANTEFFLDLQNLASLLARLESAGVDVGDRWAGLADYAATRVGDHVLTFTDAHCLLTLARSGRVDELAAFRRSLAEHRNNQQAGADTLGLDLVIELGQGFGHQAAGEHRRAADAFLAIRGDLAPIGGSHAQRDLFDLVTIDELLAADEPQTAVNLLRARTRRWPNSVPTWNRLADALAASGDTDRAAQARDQAQELTHV
jgi:tetratricopeptide (TPR) repeat protein